MSARNLIVGRERDQTGVTQIDACLSLAVDGPDDTRRAGRWHERLNWRLITGLFSLLQARKQERAKIVVKGANGRIVEAPASASPEQLAELVELAVKLDQLAIHIVER